MITIEGNMVATDGNKQFSITIDDRTNYVAGGILGGDQYYPTLQITVEEDDGKTAVFFLFTVCNSLILPTLCLLRFVT